MRWGIESLISLLKGQRRRREPLFQQAARFLEAFEAHDVSRVQLPRLLRESIRLTPQQATSVETLANHLRVEHLDWAAETLALRRDWFDLQCEQPHQVVRVYKCPGVLYRWLSERTQIRGDRHGSIHVLAEEAFEDPARAAGRFVVIYEEGFAELDDKQLSRYWYLSEGAHFEHPACVIDLLGILTVAEHFILIPKGHVVSSAVLGAAEAGTLGLIPRALMGRGGWHPQDWVPIRYDAANCRSDGHRALWEETQSRLQSDGLDSVLRLDRFCIRDEASS